MKTKDLNSYVAVYKELLKQGDIKIAYAELVKYVQTLKTSFSKDLNNEYSVGNVFQGYMDYTYFYFSNDYLKSKRLKLGLVLNHAEVRFEIWLLGQTKDVQETYWNLLKNTKWVNSSEMPQYSIFETTLVKNPNFNDLNKLTNDLKKTLVVVADEVLVSLKQMD